MPDRIITLATLTYMRAQLLCALLESEGIECFMSNMNMIKQGPGGVHVNIRELDAAEAIEIYEQFKGAYGEQKKEAFEYLKSIRRILVPVDFTAHAENAAFYALQLASKLKADIKLMNAYLDPMSTPQSYLESYTYQVDLDRIIHEIEEETLGNLKALANKLRQQIKKEKINGVNISVEMIKGSPVGALMAMVDEYKPGMVVMGTRGSKLEGLRSFGSMTAQVIKKLDIPLIAIPHNYDVFLKSGPKRILYATDFDSTDYSALRRLASFVRPFKAKIFCVHVAIENSEPLDEIQMRRIKNYIYDSLGEHNLECGLLESHDIQKGLDEFIKEKNIDVLAMTTHKRSLFERLFKPSLTKKFLFQTHIPLFIFQARP